MQNRPGARRACIARSTRTLGVFFILQCLSGSLLVIASSAEEWLNPEIATAAGDEEALLRATDRLDRERPGEFGFGVQREGGDGKLLLAI